MAMMQPYLKNHYPNRLTEYLLSEVFGAGKAEEDYYTACFCHYRLRMLTSNKRFDGKYSKLRWHIMTAASKYCQAKHKEWGCKTRNEALYNLFASNEGAWFERLDTLIKVSIPDPDLSRDVLKSQPLTNTTLANVDQLL